MGIWRSGLRLLIGVAEVLGALELIGPRMTRFLPTLTPQAAARLMIMVGGATVWRAIGGERVIVTLVLLALLILVASTRWKVQPIAAHQRSRSV